MRIDLTNVWCRFFADGPERRWLEGILTYESFGKGGVLQEYSFVNRFKPEFPSGLLHHVVTRAKADDVSVEVIDRRVRPVAPVDDADLGWLRDYQVDAINAVQKRTRGIIHSPTGSGKTEVLVGLTQRLPCKWLMLAHRGTLVANAAERYQLRTGARAGIVGKGQWDYGDGGLVCATFQTLYKALKKGDKNAYALLEGAEGLIVDESHTLPAWSFLLVANAAKNAYWRVGLSGTPLDRTDHRSQHSIGSLGRIIYRIETSMLIERGYLSQPEIEMRTVEQESDQETYAAVYRNLVVKSVPRNKAVIEMAKNAPKPCMVFVQQIQHGRLLAKNLGCDFVDGKAPDAVRQRVLKGLQNGDKDMIVASNIFNEGVDVPDLRSVVIAAGGASTIQAIQRIGRGMRKTDDKDRFKVYDINDEGQRWLKRHSRARKKAYEREGHAVTTR